MDEHEYEQRTDEVARQSRTRGSISVKIVISLTSVSLLGLVAWKQLVAASPTTVTITNNITSTNNSGNKVTVAVPGPAARATEEGPNDAFEKAAAASDINEITTPAPTREEQFRADLRRELDEFERGWSARDPAGNMQTKNEFAADFGRRLGYFKSRYSSDLSASHMTALTTSMATCAAVPQQLTQALLDTCLQNVADIVRALRALSVDRKK